MVDAKDISYLDCDLPFYLRNAIDELQKELKRSEQERLMHLDLYVDELLSSINVAETGQEISEQQAWYLREKYLGMRKDDL